jgi:apolipoprotein N-acyltransferase
MYNRFKHLTAPILSGILLASPWLGQSSFFSLFALVPFFHVIFSNNETNKQHPFAKTLSIVLTFLVWNLLSTWWISKATWTGAIIAIGINTLLMSIITEAVRIFTLKRSLLFRLLLFSSTWIVFEYLHHRWELACPWLSLGNAWATQPAWVQWYEFTGVLGGTAWILLTNGLITAWISNVTNASALRPALKTAPLLAVILLPLVASIWMFRTHDLSSTPSLRVAILQPNIDPYTEKFEEKSQQAQLQSILNLAIEASEQGPQLYVGPETALSEIWENVIDSDHQIQQIRLFLQHHAPHAHFTIGAITYKRYTNTDSLPEYTRLNREQNYRYNVYNSALTISTEKATQVTHKEKLVAGVEKMPWVSSIPFLEKWILDLGGTTGTLGNDNTRTTHSDTHGNAFATPICYESAFGAHCNKLLGTEGAYLLVITNDGWWGNTPGYKQHLNIARLRAIETRKFVVRSANTGISALIDDQGQIVQQIPWDKTGFAVGEIRPNTTLTFYARFGDWPVLAALILWSGLILFQIKSHTKKIPLV